MLNYIRIGGVASDITEGFLEKAQDFCRYIQPRVLEYEELFLKNQIFVGRLKGAGIISDQQAIRCGLSGPNLRASGVPIDVRKMMPYGAYAMFNFNVCTSPNSQGDSLDRIKMRIQEIGVSATLVLRALEVMPRGEFKQTVSRFVRVPKGEAYARVESPRGLFGVHVVSTGEKYPDRVKLRTPSFSALGLFPDILNDVQISDVGPILYSLDLCASEIDR
jgi:NADH-quinone oxidoreductase subunit D